jgi:hypothetical protein
MGHPVTVGHKYRNLVLQVWGKGLDTRLTILLSNRITVQNCKEVKTRCYLAESYKEGCGAKGAVLPMMMKMIMMGIYNCYLRSTLGEMCVPCNLFA